MVSLRLTQMSQAEKLMALEALREDLSRNGEGFESPAWHHQELAPTEERVKAGKERFVDWEQAKKDLRGRFE